MSTAAAPVIERSAALQAFAAITSSTPASPPRTILRRFSAALAIISSFSADAARNRVSPDITSVATTTSPDLSDGSSPPATPNEITPRNVVGSSVASSARSCCGSLGAADHDHAGTRRDAGLLHQSSHNQYRPRINSTVHGLRRPPPPTITSRPLPPCYWCFSRFRYRASAQSGKNFE